MSALTSHRTGAHYPGSAVLKPLSAFISSAMDVPLIRNGYALLASAGLTSVLGLVYWILAARLYSAEQVGVGAALISTMLTLGNISQLNLGNLLNRFLPTAGDRSVRLILFAYSAAAMAALLISAGSLFVITRLVDDLAFLGGQPWMAVGFVVATVAWTLFALQDSVLAGLRRSTFVPVENTIFAVSKIALLVIFAGSSLMGSGLYAAWTLPLPFLLAFVNWFVFTRFIQRHIAASASSVDPGWKAVARFYGWDYFGTIASMTAIGVAPLLVLHFSGAEMLAGYYIAWEIAYSLYLIGRSMGVSLLAEAGFDRLRLKSLMADSFVHTMLLLTLAVALLIAGAPLMMGLFGAAYSESATALLRILALSCLPWGFVTIALAIARAQGETVVVALAQLVTMTIVLGAGAPLLWTYGTIGMGMAWLAAHSFVAAGIIAYAVFRFGKDVILESILRVGSALARLRAALKPNIVASHDLSPLPPLLSRTGVAGAERWLPLVEFRRGGDVRTILVGERSEASGSDGVRHEVKKPRAVCKISTSREGANAIMRHLEHIEGLKADGRLHNLDVMLPELMAVEKGSDFAGLLERALPGHDGRKILQIPGERAESMASAANIITEIHGRSAQAVTINQNWIDRWISRPSESLLPAVNVVLNPAERGEAIRALRREQAQFWRGRSIHLGRGHGDFCPGNILFAPRKNCVKPAVRTYAADVTAIVDWESATEDAPPGLDLIYLLLTARALHSGDEIGHVVRGILLRPRFTDEEMKWLRVAEHEWGMAYGSMHDEAAIRAICGLAWLQHVSSNLGKTSQFARKRLWVAVNVDRVLQLFLHPKVIQ